MGRVIAAGPGGKAQAPQRSDNFRHVIDAVRAMKGLDQLFLTPPCRSHDHAQEVRQGLYRSARYYCSCGDEFCTRKHSNIEGCPDGGQRISVRADVVTVTPPEGRRRYHVQVTFFDKREAIRAVIARHGADPNNWPYFARSKRKRK